MMLCFEFFGDPSLDVVFCEEAIRYNPARSEGLSLAATVVVKSRGHGLLQAIHPRAIESVKLSSAGSWERFEQEDGFPYSKVFATLIPDRLSKLNDTHWQLQAFPEMKDLSREAEKLNVEIADGETFGFKVFPKNDPDAPYTLLEFGPFPERQSYYIFRIHAHINGSSYDDLIADDLPTGMRLYKVYGGNYLFTYIREIFMAPSRLENNPHHSDYRKRFESFVLSRRKIPSTYSIVAIDHPACHPGRMEPIDLTSDMCDLTARINPDIHHATGLDPNGNRMFWFVTKEPSSSFFLQLLGPALEPVLI